MFVLVREVTEVKQAENRDNVDLQLDAAVQVPHQVPRARSRPPAPPMPVLFAPSPAGSTSDPTAGSTPGEGAPGAHPRRARPFHPLLSYYNTS